MLSENIKNLRKSKGISQEELAVKLGVVRQTVSKWEKGLSVPDSEMLMKIAEALDTTVNVLLGETVSANDITEIQMLAAKLELLNEQFAKRNKSRRMVLILIFIAVGVLALRVLVFGLIEFLFMLDAMTRMDSSIGIIGGADGPTAIMVSREGFIPVKIIVAVIVLIVAVVGIYKTSKK